MSVQSLKVDVAMLYGIANEIGTVTPAYATEQRLQALQGFLQRVREATGTDVAFVSRLDRNRRVFEVVSVVAGSPADVAAGDSEALIDTYCKLVIDGLLPAAIPDVAHARAAAILPITQRLAIRAYLSARILLRDGTVYGTLCCFSHATRPDLRQADADALQAVARAIAQAIQRDGALTPPAYDSGPSAPVR